MFYVLPYLLIVLFSRKAQNVLCSFCVSFFLIALFGRKAQNVLCFVYLLIGLFSRKPGRPVLHDEALAGDDAGAAPPLHLRLAAAAAVAAVPPRPVHQLCNLPP